MFRLHCGRGQQLRGRHGAVGDFRWNARTIDDLPGLDRTWARAVTTTRYALTLATLTGLFTLRVGGQALVAFVGVEFLPPMEQWYSGLMPYPLLLPTQLAMIVAMIAIVRNVARRGGMFSVPRRRLGVTLVWASYAYALSMVARYAVTMALYPERRWFGHTIPIWFHFVLAAFLYTLGRYHIAFAPAAPGQAPV